MKRLEALHGLSDDHHFGLILARRCRRVGLEGHEPFSAALWQTLVASSDAHLTPHFQIEETHLLPALEQLGEPERADRIRSEHETLRALAQQTPGPDALHAFGELLHTHIRYEEREVFEPLQHQLPDEVRTAIAAACSATPRVCSFGD